MCRVLNKRSTGVPAGAVYIGRGSKWGNPFRIGPDGARASVIAKYERWLREQHHLLRAIDELRGHDLVCFCAPLACHRLSFTRFLRLGIEDSIPDGTTLWLFRETLAKAGLIEKFFERFGQHLEAKGYIARGGQMVDATIVPVPKQRNSRDENEDVKAPVSARARAQR